MYLLKRFTREEELAYGWHRQNQTLLGSSKSEGIPDFHRIAAERDNAYEHVPQFSKGVNVAPRPDNVCLDAGMEGGTTRDDITMSRGTFSRIILQLRPRSVEELP